MVNVFPFMLLMILAGNCLSDSKEIRFNITPLSFPPYIVHDPLGGIMFDVLTEIAEKHGYRITVAKVPENRVISLLSSNQLDVHASAMEWMPPSNEYLFSDPILMVRDVIFMVSGTEFQLDGVNSLFGRRLGVRTGYTYQSLDEYFDSGMITRIDSNSELYLLRMLENGRINLAVITEHVGLWLIARNQFNVNFNQTRKAVDATNYRFVFSKEWAEFVAVFNQELNTMKKEKKLERIIERYR